MRCLVYGLENFIKICSGKNMKNLKEYIVTENNFFKNLGIGIKVQIEKWLQKQYVENYTINDDDLTIDVDGKVDLSFYEKEQLPDFIQFGKVNGDFTLYYSTMLLSLKGCPKEVDGDFTCTNCKKLKSLEGCPQKVGKNFYCNMCTNLNSLKGCPEEVGESFYCDECKNLKSLKGGPQKVGKDFDCGYCKNLKSLEGCPKEVGGSFYCDICGVDFTKDDVKKVCNVKVTINV